MERIKEHKISTSLVLFLTLIAQLSVGCKIVAVPKGPWRTKERIIRREPLREPLKETEVLRRTLEINRVTEDNCNDARRLAQMRKLNRWGVIGLQLAARLECDRKWREVYFVEQIRDFKVHGCRGAASFLCMILPVTIITAIVGVPLLAYGVRKLRRAGEHDANAVGIIAAGGGLVGAGLAGVFSCPISKARERRCNRMRKKFRKSGPKRRVVKERVDDCGRELLKDTTVMVRIDAGDSGPLPTFLKTNRDAEVMVDLMHLMAERGMKRPPEKIIVSANKNNEDAPGGAPQLTRQVGMDQPPNPEVVFESALRADSRIRSQDRGRRGARPARRDEGEYIDVFNQRATQQVGMDRRPNPEVIFESALRPVIMEVGEELRKRMVSATRRETVAVKATTNSESLRRFSRPFPGNVRYRIIELSCSEKLRMVLSGAGGQKGKIWFESRLRRGNQQENRGKERNQGKKEQDQFGKERDQGKKEQDQFGKELDQVGIETDQVEKEQDLDNRERRKKSVGGKISGVGVRGLSPGKAVSFVCSPQTSTWIYLLAPPAGRRQDLEFEWRAERAE